ncbi:MAG: hypothetical protein AAF790_02830 [Planctomycetota bacterium]
MEKISDIPQLLHDTSLLSIEVDEPLRSACFWFKCLRRNVDGSDLDDTIVELRVTSVERIAAYYDAESVSQRFSELPDIQLLALDGLKQLEVDNPQCAVAIDSHDEYFNLETAGRVDWLLGEPPVDSSMPTEQCLFVTIDTRHHRKSNVRSSLMIQGASVEPWAGGVPLSIHEWGLQYSAWWKGWEQHWAANESAESEDESKEEGRFIPAGADETAVLSFEPPAKPPFLVSSSDVDGALLEPIRDYLEGIIARDWSRVARALPDLDVDMASRARELETQFLGHDFGRWVYQRQLDTAWKERYQACVTLRGVEFVGPLEGEPAEANETVVSYGLRRLRDRWVIRTFCQGWPAFGSAPESASAKPWLDEWVSTTT